MRARRILAVGLTACLLVFVAGLTQAVAVVNGPLDGNNHPSVGFIFAQTTDPGTCNAQIVGNCAAILVSSTVAITSGGCADEFATGGGFPLTAIWINLNPDDPTDCTTAVRVDSIHVHPGYVAGQQLSPSDIGVLVLAAPATVAPATLPTANSQGGYVKGDPFEIVNWSGVSKGNVGDYRRRFSPAEFTSGDADFLGFKLTLSGGHICYGTAQGGGSFLPSSQNLTSLIVDGSAGGCKNGQLLRLDTTNVRDFLDDYMTLP